MSFHRFFILFWHQPNNLHTIDSPWEYLDDVVSLLCVFIIPPYCRKKPLCIVSFCPFFFAAWTGKPIVCCRDDGQWPLPRYIHPGCDAVSVSDDDPVYGEHRVRCLTYVRSLPVLRTDCTFGPAEQVGWLAKYQCKHQLSLESDSHKCIFFCTQMNQVSHFLDGSTIYGSTLTKSSKIRTYEGGLLRVNLKNGREYLPVAKGDLAALCTSKNCYLSGKQLANVR